MKKEKEKLLDDIVLKLGRFHFALVALVMFNILLFAGLLINSLIFIGFSVVGIFVFTVYWIIQSTAISGRVMRYNEIRKK